MKFFVLMSAAAVLTLIPSGAQIRINEFMASNQTAFPDVTDFEDYPDWIELHNASDAVVDLAGYFLSDDAARPYRWAFPGGAVIPPQGFLLVMADGHDASPGMVYPRGYWPWKNFTTEKYHTNFALSAGGDEVLLTKIAGLTATALITPAYPAPVPPAAASVWKFLDTGVDPGPQWKARIFNDSAWASGPGRLGYGDSPATVLSFGPDSAAKHITTYFRRAFTVADPASVHGLNLKLLVDDGAVVYLNGSEVVRRNLPEGGIAYDTLASTSISGADETTAYYPYSLSAEDLVAGENVIAVEVHQVDPGSSDLNFDLELTAQSHASGTIVDSVTYGQQVTDLSTGRNEGNPELWQTFAEATPGSPNTTGTVNDSRISGPEVSISLAGGFYSGPQSVTLSTSTGEIRYTLDGSIPGSTSPLYNAPLNLTATTVLRARAFLPGTAPGPVQTRTWFFGETPGAVPFISVVADPATLFGDGIGIYRNLHEPVTGAYGLHDVYKGKEAPASLEFFAPGGTPGFRAEGGIKIGGENNWVHPQKAMNFYTEDKSGGDAIVYDLFPGTGIPVHASFTMRDGGDNWDKDMLRDAMTAPLVGGAMQLDASEYRQSLVFINGAYYGIHDLRVRWDNTWFQQKHRVNYGSVDHLLYGHVTSSAVTLGAEEGDTADWLDLLAFLNGNDLTLPANWNFVESRINLDSFIDFVIFETYCINTSWQHNREFWRERKPGAKWKWFMTDVDRGFDTANLGSGVLGAMLDTDDVLRRLKTNSTFKNRLLQRLAAHNASTFNPSRVQALITRMDLEIAPFIPRHAARWAPDGTTVSRRAAQIQEIKDFATQREASIYTEAATQLGAGPPVNLTLAVDPPNAGHVLAAGVPVSPGLLKFFPQVPLEFTPEGAPGFTFTGWTGAPGSGKATLTLTGTTLLTAHFSASGETVLGGTLAEDTTLSAAASPYTLSSDVIVPPGISLTVPAGVTLKMPKRRNLRVQGALLVNGTAAQPVTITGRGDGSWGAISLENPTAPCHFSHVTIRQATRGFDPLHYIAAISGLNATMELDFVDIEGCENPVFARGGSTIVRDSRLHTSYPGDCINVKQGSAQVIRSVFTGSMSPDCDGVDFDGVNNGLIQDNTFYRFLGGNCDAMDIGEGTSNLLVEGNKVFFCADKGISVGQGSTVTARKNLITGCYFGVGAKDAGSTAILDQNTFSGNQIALAAYEKNYGRGGGTISGENLILSGNGLAPFTVDVLSGVTLSYSLSDSTFLPGTGNLQADPQFTDAASLNFQLLPGSPAIDGGNPAHVPDSDGSPADLGAHYVYSPSHYPFTLGNSVVINEVLAQTGGSADWIELHNRTGAAVDLSGWFLSDSGADPLKYRIPAGTLLPAGGYLVFDGPTRFGTASIDPGRITPFAVSNTGNTLYLSSAVNDELTDYQSREEFGPSLEGESLGTYYKPATDSWNFVAQRENTPRAANGKPRIGPIVISEIMYHPAGSADAEYVELLNVSPSPVTLYDEAKGKAWRLTDGLDFEFPVSPPVTMAPGERVLLVKNLLLFGSSYSVPPGTRIFEWTSGKLANEGETLQLDRPGAVDAQGTQHYVRVDRVAYTDALPWPGSADGTGPALAKITENDYGNDAVNWSAQLPSPGAVGGSDRFPAWAQRSGLSGSDAAAAADPDHDGLSNLLEYAFGLNAAVPDAAAASAPALVLNTPNGDMVEFEVDPARPDVAATLEFSPTLESGSWITLESTPVYLKAGKQIRRAIQPYGDSARGYYRLRMTLAP